MSAAAVVVFSLRAHMLDQSTCATVWVLVSVLAY